MEDSEFNPDVRGRYYFDQKGLAVDLHDSVAEVFAGCATEVIIPYREIRAVVRSDKVFSWLISP